MAEPNSDEQLLDLLQGGNHDAFTQLYRRYWERMFYLAGKKLGDLTEAESVVQDVFLDLWERREELRIDRLENYLAVAVKYRVLNILARRERERRAMEAGSAHSAQHPLSPEEWLSFDELRNWLDATTRGLPEKCRIVYELRNAGFAQQEIADRLGISIKTVQAHVTRALKELRTSIGQFWTLIPAGGLLALSLLWLMS